MTTLEQTRCTHNPDAPVAPDWAAADLYAFQNAVLRSDLPPLVKVVACAIALSSQGRSGEGATINLDALEQITGRKATAIKGYVNALRGTWLEQTVKPTSAGWGAEGRRARYRLRVPVSQLVPERADRLGFTSEAVESRSEAERVDRPRFTSETQNRGRKSAESWSVAKRESAPVLQVLELQELNPPPLPPVDEPEPVTRTSQAGGRGQHEEPQPASAVARVLPFLSPGHAVAAQNANALGKVLSTAMGAGWKPEQIAQRLNAKPLAGLHDPSAGVVIAARTLLSSSPPKPPAPPKTWCGKCDQIDRTVEQLDGRISKCHCHQTYTEQACA